MGEKKRGDYYRSLANNQLSHKAIDKILSLLEKHLTLYPVPPDVLSGQDGKGPIRKSLTKLPLYLALGQKSWGGLVVCFPGNISDLSTENVSTPYLRKLLYPILDLHQRLQTPYSGQLRNIYLVGERFSDVFLRKFRLLDSITPNVIVLTGDMFKAKVTPANPSEISSFNEDWVQAWLSQKLLSDGGLEIPTSDGCIQAGFLAYELPTGEGTKNPERLDVLAYDRKDKSLIAFELKGPSCNRSEFENIFLQGMEHRNWLEMNKMAVRFFFDGVRSKRINARKRVRLVLGFFQDHVPLIFLLLRHEAIKKDRHLKIDFVQIQGSPETGLMLFSLDDQKELEWYLKNLEIRQQCNEGFYIDEYGRKTDEGLFDDID